jgi:preprotein translocase subunit SecA
MERFDVPEDQPIEFKMVTSAVEQAQEKVEGANFDLRKHLLDYDDVLNKQRAAVYKRRVEFLSLLNKEDVAKTIQEITEAHFDGVFGGGAGFGDDRREEMKKAFQEATIADASTFDAAEDPRKLLEALSQKVAEHSLARNQLLGTLDMLWMTNLEDLEALSEAVALRAYGQRDPLVEYRQEASRLFKTFWASFNGLVFANIFKLLQTNSGQAAGSAVQRAHVGHTHVSNTSGAEKIGRNDPCPCGSGKKWKKCGLLNTEEHQKNMAAGGKPKHEVTGG